MRHSATGRQFSVSFGAALAAAALAVAPLAAPAAATEPPDGGHQTLSAVTAQGGVCEVTGGTLTWGLKESFRAYISGSIANGAWETSGGAAYEIPNFVWSTPTGSYDPATGTGIVSFPGTVHFTGHDGVLDLTLANPTIEFEGGGVAALMLDSRSTDMEGEVAIDESQVWMGEVAAPEQLGVDGGQVTVSEAPVTLTNTGAAAFAGFYEPGVELDPINIDLSLEGCEGGPAAAPGGDAADGADEAGSADDAAPAVIADTGRVPWLPITIGGIALVVIGFTGGLMIGTARSAKRAPVQHSPVDGSATLNG